MRPKNLFGAGKKFWGHTSLRYQSNDLQLSVRFRASRVDTFKLLNSSVPLLNLKKNLAQSSIHTRATRAKFSFRIPLTPPGNVYGELFRNRWPTCEQGAISTSPPHCHTRKDISKLSPPQIFNRSSYAPISKKYFRSIVNNPPAIAGVWNGVVVSFLLSASSSSLNVYHRKCNGQLNAPQ
uniref:Uncharacterized protein n=1 Tax=Anopheles christyi TaxID=43041 RepID=A0A182KIY3_9DIPT